MQVWQECVSEGALSTTVTSVKALFCFILLHCCLTTNSSLDDTSKTIILIVKVIVQ